jgi:hypothetical protein
LFSLDFRPLADRMFFARHGKQEDDERNSDDPLANERTHDALGQLSVSAAERKDESATIGRDRRARRIIPITITTLSRSKSKPKRQRKSYD